MSDFNDIREYLKSIELSHLKLIASRINKDDTIKTSQPRSKIEKAISMRYLQNNNNSYAITKKDIKEKNKQHYQQYQQNLQNQQQKH